MPPTTTSLSSPLVSIAHSFSTNGFLTTSFLTARFAITSFMRISYFTLSFLAIGFLTNNIVTKLSYASDGFKCTRFLDYRESANPTGKASNAWYSVNDNVMGGRSLGSFSLEDHSLNFKGSINTNGGGFASIRHELPPNLLATADRLRLSVQSDGRGYSIHLRDQQSSAARLAHRAPLRTPPSQDFQTIEVLFSELVPTFRGRAVEAEPFVPSDALSLSIMLSDGIDGQFSLNVEWLEICQPNS